MVNLFRSSKQLNESFAHALEDQTLLGMPNSGSRVRKAKTSALEPLLAGIESLSERIREYNERIEKLARETYPQAALLKQVKGVGTLIALTFLLTLEDAQRFRKSRDVGCYLGLQPGRRNSGQSEPQMHAQEVDT